MFTQRDDLDQDAAPCVHVETKHVPKRAMPLAPTPFGVLPTLKVCHHRRLRQIELRSRARRMLQSEESVVTFLADD